MLKIICYYGSKEIYRFPLLESVGHCLPACFLLTLDGNIMYNVSKGGIQVKRAIAILTIISLFVFVGCGKPVQNAGESDGNLAEEETLNETEETNEDEEFEIEIEKEPSVKDKAELNAEKFPAGPGSTLVTKGDHNFTGMDYYFRGEVIKITIIENSVGNPSAWLVKNDKGYVMPIQHDGFEASEGDMVEVWGTLTGNGYSNFEGIDNVVGETGSMHAITVEVN